MEEGRADKQEGLRVKQGRKEKVARRMREEWRKVEGDKELAERRERRRERKRERQRGRDNAREVGKKREKRITGRKENGK